ncbi:Trifunctional nucleotide phosphoesterase proteinYfkN [Acaryochloris thomasi RCC1774]|uniref:Trifunctional nucleotide phosphoesterase proteinYfkN n=1 Tax=Acaryochloris thomasi RCC1774 TaxID=1764569 RepID=A0A2W1JDN2_9CYAN|nr:choice-of-anchor I family protein [Acaryochloris thomasi]PZD71856.1 Trifunctional nucleotide phosphoesterase proteinYfkN [Acaryochloris thomasi RCC1774]
MAIELNQIGTFATGVFDESAAEIVAFDSVSQRLFVVNGDSNGIDVLDLSDPTRPTLIDAIDVSLSGGPNSVAVANGVVAVALEDVTATETGTVAFFDAADLSLLNVVGVGVLPDAVTFTPNGTRLVVANEGEPVGDDDDLLTFDPEGSISIIDLTEGVEGATVATADFSAFNGRENDLRGDGVRIFPGRTVAQDLEPEFISVAPDGSTAFVTLQENNAIAVVNLETAELVDILPLGVTDFSRGLPQLETFDIPDLTTDSFQIGTDADGNPIFLGGLSGLAFDGVNPENGNPRFLAINDRGPVSGTIDTPDPDSSNRPFLVPDLQVTVLTLELDEASGQVSVVDRLGLTREVDGAQVPITGLPNIPGFFEVPVDPATGEPLPNDPFGLDSEGIVRAPNGNLFVADEQGPSINVFSSEGVLIDRFVPTGFAAQDESGATAGTFGTETLPEVYLNRRNNRGFEGIAFDDERNIVYGFIQTPLSNPDTDTSNGSSILRILGIDPTTGEPVEEFVYVLQTPSLITTDSGIDFGDAEVDRIGDVVFAGNGQFYVIERDNEDIDTAQQRIFQIDLQGATNILGTDLSNATEGTTIEQLSPDELVAAGIQPVNKIQVTNLPSLGFSPSAQAEGLALLEDGRLAVINDNDYEGPGTSTQLGLISFDEATNGLDPSDEDGGINIDNFPVFGLFQPDTIASFDANGQTFFITANEGDGRDSFDDLTDIERVEDLTLDPEAFPDAANLQLEENLGRLEVSSVDGDIDGDGDFDQLFAFGSRSFSIRDALGNLVFDSGDQLERITAELLPEAFNSDNDENGSFDSRSNDSGPEPEGLAVGVVGDRTYAFIGLERIGGIVVFDVSDPANSEFVQYINNRDFTVDVELPDGTLNPAAGDLGPEGLLFISAEDSPNGSPLLVVGNEVSGSTTIFEIDDLGDGDGLTSISTIQGEGHVSTLVDSDVTTSGVVTAVAFNGFYLQDPTGDGNDNTSDGIFVFTGSTPDIAVGDQLEVAGTVGEFIPGGADTGNLSITQIASSEITVLSSGNALPEAVVIRQSGRSPSNTTVISDDELPVNLRDTADDAANTFDPENDAIDFFESIEGQRVTIEDAVTVSPTRVFGDFSAEAFTLPNQGATSDDPPNSRGGIPLNSGPDNTGDQNPERVQIQFDPTISGEEIPPALNVGDQLGDVTGVVGYSFGNFEVNVTGPVNVVTPGGLEQEVTTLTGSEDQLTIASYNVLNLTSTAAVEDDVTDPDARQRSLLAEQIVANLGSPDIIALQEIQDNDGASGGDNIAVSDASQTLQDLVDAIATSGGPTYEFFDVFADSSADESTIPQGGVPGGNIRNAFLYNPERVSLDSTEALTPANLESAGVSNPDALAGSRIPLAGTFSFNGEAVTVINNHFSSRFGSTPIFGGTQPFVQAAEAEREAQSLAINEYVDAALAAQSDANIVVTGDLNTFQFTNDLAEILPGTGDEQVLTNLVSQAEAGGDASTFIFDGNSQVLDHSFVSDSLLPEAKFDIVHVNNDFTRDDNAIEFNDTVVASDHEPLVSRLNIGTDAPASNFTLQILHASDLEGGVDAIGRAPNFAALIDNFEDQFENSITLSAGDNYLAGPFFNAAGDQAAFRDSGIFNDLYNGLFNLPADVDGDAIEDFYAGLREGGGRVDIAIMNLIGFDASAIGNHEFDLGSDTLADIIAPDFRDPGLEDDRNVGALFPYLSANLDFSGDEVLSELFTNEILTNTDFRTGPEQSLAGTEVPKIAPSTIIDEGGEQIGVIGATTQILDSISSPTGTTVIGPQENNMVALAETLQPEVDRLRDLGINKIVLVSHLQQIALEQELAGLLDGVDVIIAGGSDTLLADATDTLRPGDVADGDYPFETTDANGNPVLIVSTDGEYSYVGRLVLEFDAEGNVITDSVDSEVSGAYATTDEVVNEVYGTEGVEDAMAEGRPSAIASSTKATGVQQLTNAVSDVVAEQDGNVFGQTDVFIDGRRESVRTEETNIGNLTADANLAAAQAFDETVVLSLKNGGGIRAPIGEIDADGKELPPQANPVSGKEEGQISQLDIDNSLRFNNSLTLLTLTADQLLEVVEHSVAATEEGATPGQFSQISGVQFSFDPDADPGDRVQSLTITDADGNDIDTVVQGGELVGETSRTFRIVTLNFLADGGDGYPFPTGPEANRVDLPDVLTDAGAATFADPGTEQDVLAEYLATNFPADDDATTPAFSDAETDPAEDTRIQNLNFREDTVIDAPQVNEITGTNFSDVLIGTAESDAIEGLNGNDVIRGLLGDDFLLGNNGSDNIRGGAGHDTLLGGNGFDRLDGRRGDDVIEGGNGNDFILGGRGADLLSGGADRDQIAGNLGADTLIGGSGRDLLSGGRGADLFVLEVGQGRDFIRDFEMGQDALGLSDGLTVDQLGVSIQGGNTLIVFEEENQQLAVLSNVAAEVEDLTFQTFSSVV